MNTVASNRHHSLNSEHIIFFKLFDILCEILKKNITFNRITTDRKEQKPVDCLMCLSSSDLKSKVKVIKFKIIRLLRQEVLRSVMFVGLFVNKLASLTSDHHMQWIAEC